MMEEVAKYQLALTAIQEVRWHIGKPKLDVFLFPSKKRRLLSRIHAFKEIQSCGLEFPVSKRKNRESVKKQYLKWKNAEH